MDHTVDFVLQGQNILQEPVQRASHSFDYLAHDCPERLLAAQVGLVEDNGLSRQLLHPSQTLRHAGTWMIVSIMSSLNGMS